MSALHFSAVFCSFISLLCLLAALGSDYWLTDSGSHLGLWKICNLGACQSLGVEWVSAAFHVIRIFMFLGMIAGVVSLGGLCVMNSQPRLAYIASFTAGLCVMIAMSIFSAMAGSTSKFGWSFGLGWASFSLYLLNAYNVFVIGLLATAAAYIILLPLVLILLYVCKTSKSMSKKYKRTILIPGLATMIAMSLYTGHYTYELDYEARGFPFWLTWSSFPICLVAAFAGLCQNILQEIEEENEIILNVIPGN